MSAIRTVARRELTERLGSRVTWFTIGITALLVVALIAVPAIFRRPPKPVVLGLVGPAARQVASLLPASANVTTVDMPDDATARADLASGAIDVALQVTATGAVAQVEQSLPGSLGSVLQPALDQAHARQVLGTAGVAPATIRSVLTPQRLDVQALKPSRPTSFGRTAQVLAAFAAGILVYLTLAIYGTAVSSGVAQEKTSRTAEVLLAAVRPSQLLAGKVVGIGITGLVHMGVVLAAALLANTLVKGTPIAGTIWLLLPSILLWFLLGYALYGAAYAAAGAMVARQEDLQSVSTPITLLLVGNWLLMYAVVGLPGAGWVAALSIVPFFAPALIPARLAMGAVPGWQVAAAILLMLAAIYGTVHLAARIYTRALMHGGERLSWRAAARL